jgi:11beta/17beta-hydroxysteroid dehydrogenase
MSLRKVGDRALAFGLRLRGVLVLPADVSMPDQCDKFIDDLAGSKRLRT